MKKILSMVILSAMCLSMSVPTFANGVDRDNSVENVVQMVEEGISPYWEPCVDGAQGPHNSRRVIDGYKIQADGSGRCVKYEVWVCAYCHADPELRFHSFC